MKIHSAELLKAMEFLRKSQVSDRVVIEPTPVGVVAGVRNERMALEVRLKSTAVSAASSLHPERQIADMQDIFGPPQLMNLNACVDAISGRLDVLDLSRGRITGIAGDAVAIKQESWDQMPVRKATPTSVESATLHAGQFYSMLDAVVLCAGGVYNSVTIARSGRNMRALATNGARLGVSEKVTHDETSDKVKFTACIPVRGASMLRHAVRQVSDVCRVQVDSENLFLISGSRRAVVSLDQELSVDFAEMLETYAGKKNTRFVCKASEVISSLQRSTRWSLSKLKPIRVTMTEDRKRLVFDACVRRSVAHQVPIRRAGPMQPFWISGSLLLSTLRGFCDARNPDKEITIASYGPEDLLRVSAKGQAYYLAAIRQRGRGVTDVDDGSEEETKEASESLTGPGELPTARD